MIFWWNAKCVAEKRGELWLHIRTDCAVLKLGLVGIIYVPNLRFALSEYDESIDARDGTTGKAFLQWRSWGSWGSWSLLNRVHDKIPFHLFWTQHLRTCATKKTCTTDNTLTLPSRLWKREERTIHFCFFKLPDSTFRALISKTAIKIWKPLLKTPTLRKQETKKETIGFITWRCWNKVPWQRRKRKISLSLSKKC